MSKNLDNIFENKKILVTGATGSIGSELVRRLVKYNPAVIRVFSNDENAQFVLDQELGSHKNLRFFIGDVREKDRLQRAMDDIDIVFHAAALKHVPLCEYNPFEAVKTNIMGTQNMLELAIDNDVEKVITISTDKAVNPVNVMGATKLLAERLTVAANYYKGSKRTDFSCVRFGNVLNSRGSVIPIFRNQIQKGGPVTITDPDMLRFVMPIEKAVGLVLKSAQLSKGREIFILKMPAVRIGDLAEVMIHRLSRIYGFNPTDIKIDTIGRRKGEKAYEDLMTEDEAIYSEELDDMFIIRSEELHTGGNTLTSKQYTSRDTDILTKPQIDQLLTTLDLES